MKQIFERPPTRVAEQNASGLWTTRPWGREELYRYITEVLHRKPTEQDYANCSIERRE